MPSENVATRAYAAALINRTPRQQEADVFRLVVARLQAALHADAIARVRALADNRRLWTTVSDLVRDAGNSLPPETRAGIVSIGLTVQKEMDADAPNFDFLITVNKHIAAGLSGEP
ncbi:MAG: flagellar biosynthesis regulator FlhF [Acetobacteraceae bacterium]|nr:flagellar biosynthesis regulator FlhF [Acetobacteraceae bacterium]